VSQQFDPSADFAFVDGGEPVTLRRPASGMATAIGHALRRAVATREAAASGGKYTSADVAWHLPLASAPALAVGDQIVDGQAVRWTVLEIQQSAQTARLRCLARNLVVHHGLSEIIRIQRAVWTAAASGAATPHWVNDQVGLRARIQARQGVVEHAHGRRLLKTTHQIYVAEQVTLDDSQRIVSADEQVFNVVSYENPWRIDELVVINVVQTPWPQAGS